jgi:hypothetical protein
MKFDNLIELAKAVGNDILLVELTKNKKFPINKDLKLDIDMLPEDENGDLAREDPDEFIRLVNNSISNRLNYMYEEGFLAKKKAYYRIYTEKELRDQLLDISINGVD